MGIVRFAIATVTQWLTKDSVKPKDGRPAVIVTEDGSGVPKEVVIKVGYKNRSIGQLPTIGRRLPNGFKATGDVGGVVKDEDLSYQDPVDVLTKLLQPYQAPTLNVTMVIGGQNVTSKTSKLGESLPASIPINLTISNLTNVLDSSTSGNISCTDPNLFSSGLGSFNARNVQSRTLVTTGAAITSGKTITITVSIKSIKNVTIVRTLDITYLVNCYFGESNLAKLSSSSDVLALGRTDTSLNLSYNLNYLGGNKYHYACINNVLNQDNIKFYDTTANPDSVLPFPMAVQNFAGASGAYDTTAVATITVNNGYINEVYTIYRSVNKLVTTSKVKITT